MTAAATWLVGASFGQDPSQVRDVARELLSRSPFREQQPSGFDQLVERIGAFVGELLGRVLRAVGSETAVAWVIVTIGAGLLLVALWRWTRGLRMAGEIDVEVPATRGRSSSDWLRASDTSIDAGDLDEGLRLRYLAVVAALVEQGILQDVPGRTIRELDAELSAAQPDLAPSVTAAGERLERVTYGGDAADGADIEVVDTALERVAPRGQLVG